MADRLPEPIFTPASKAPAGQHDENIDFDAIVSLVGREHANGVRRIALDVYRFAAEHARARDIIIADTKFEFGIDAAGNLLLIDEVLTPDSSRFWPVASYRPGISPPSFDKQFVRDYLESLHWDKKPPAPHLPADILARTSDNYRKALRLLTSLGAPAHAQPRWNVSKTDCFKSRAAWARPGDRCCGCCAIPAAHRARLARGRNQRARHEPRLHHAAVAGAADGLQLRDPERHRRAHATCASSCINSCARWAAPPIS